MDTALSVATEMVAELDITDQDVTSIADMIDGEIASLVPEWKLEPWTEETNQSFCHNCVSNHVNLLSHNKGGKNLQPLPCSWHGCASMHGRFEEITIQSEEYDNHVRDDAPNILNLPPYESWNQHESRELSPVGSPRSHSDEQYEQLDKSVLTEEGVWEDKFAPNAEENSLQNLLGTNYFSTIGSLYCEPENEYEKETQHELRWLRAKYQMELRELKDSCWHSEEHKSHPDLDTQRARNREVTCSDEESFQKRLLLPDTLHRTVSLPVDAVDV